MEKRYQILIGKYGMYFYDKQEQKDMTLEEILSILNKEVSSE